jgi:hypothetical protein
MGIGHSSALSRASNRAKLIDQGLLWQGMKNREVTAMISNLLIKIAWVWRHFYKLRSIWRRRSRRSHGARPLLPPAIRLGRYPEARLSPFHACAECCMPRGWGCEHDHG